MSTKNNTTKPIRKDNELLLEAGKQYIPQFITRLIYRKPKQSTLNIRGLL